MNGAARPFAALRRGALRATRLFCNARFLARSLLSDLSLLRSGLSSDYFFRTRHVPIPVGVEFLAALRLFCIARFLARFARYAAFCIARFLARCMFSGHSARHLCLRPSLLAVTLRLAYQEPHERRGEAVRKLDRKYCQYCNQIIFLHRACACT